MIDPDKLKRYAFFDCEMLELGDLTAEGPAPLPAEIPLVRWGKNRFTKGSEQGEFEFTERDADAVITEFTSRGRDLVVDFEHQTMRGVEAPAAGWINRLKKTAYGLVGDVKYWTDRAANYLRNREYRNSSGVFQFSRTGKSIVGIHSVALTNHPALHNNPALSCADDAAGHEEFNHNNETTRRKLKMKGVIQLLALGDLSEEAQENKAVELVRDLQAKSTKVDEFLSLHKCNSLDAVTGKIQGMVPMSDLTDVKTQLDRKNAEEAVAKAMSEGKVSAAYKDWATKFAMRGIQEFNDWAASAPVVAPSGDDAKVAGDLGSPAAGKGGEGAGKPNADELSICRMLSLSDEAIEKIDFRTLKG